MSGRPSPLRSQLPAIGAPNWSPPLAPSSVGPLFIDPDPPRNTCTPPASVLPPMVGYAALSVAGSVARGGLAGAAIAAREIDEAVAVDVEEASVVGVERRVARAHADLPDRRDQRSPATAGGAHAPEAHAARQRRAG